MRVGKLELSAFVLAIAMLTSLSASQGTWNLGSSEDWLSTGSVYHIGPFYYPTSDLPLATQQFLYTYPAYMPLGSSNYYQPYYPVYFNTTGSYPTGIYHIGYYNPYLYNPQYELDLAAAAHAYQKSLANATGKYRYPYPSDPQYELDLAAAAHAYQKSLTNYYNKYYWNYPY
jgi:hypothetical protein